MASDFGKPLATVDGVQKVGKKLLSRQCQTHDLTILIGKVIMSSFMWNTFLTPPPKLIPYTFF